MNGGDANICVALCVLSKPPPHYITPLLTSLQKLSVKKPYIITVSGVNGVGKTTTIAKLCSLITKSVPGKKICVACCDTFRSGAIEQVKQHGKNLNFQVYEQGAYDDRGSRSRRSLKRASQKLYTCPRPSHGR